MTSKNDVTFGRLHVPDARDANYPMALGLAFPPAPTWRFWRPFLPSPDQGQTPECTAFAWMDWERCAPGRVLAGIDDPAAFYKAEQKVDGIPGPHDGSTVRAGAAVMQREGRIGSYLWAQHAVDLRNWVLSKGSVVVGSDWTNDMFTPDRFGVVHPTGGVAGGHAYLVVGFSSTGHYRIQNSWGPSWADHGQCWIAAPDLEDLVFNNGGEAAAAVEVRVVPLGAHG